jgi:hypothetical protein
MEKKNFFKSVSFKCIVTLLVIVLVSGILLTFCNTLFTVSSEERTARAVSKLYGTTYDVERYSAITDDYTYTLGEANISDACWVAEKNDWCIKSTGTGGYDNGTVTCWIAVNMTGKSGSIAGITGVYIESNTNQSFISRANKPSVLNAFGELYTTDIEYTQDMITGATVVKTKTAICNSVNGALNYVNQVILGKSSSNPFAGFDYTDNINATYKNNAVEVADDQSITFTFKTRGATANAGGFEVQIVVGADKKISQYTIVKNGSSDDFFGNKTVMATNANYFIGKGIDDIKALLSLISKGDNYDPDTSKIGPSFTGTTELNTGATESNWHLAIAALFATANYDKAIANANGGNN